MPKSQAIDSSEMSLEEINSQVRGCCDSIIALKKKAINKLIQEKIESLYTVNEDLYKIIATFSESVKDVHIDVTTPKNIFINRIREEFETEMGLPEPGKFMDHETMNLITKLKIVNSILQNLKETSNRIIKVRENIGQNSKKD